MRLLALALTLSTALPACASSPVAGPPDLEQPYGCGHGFYLGNADQTAGLFLTPQGEDPASASGTFRLPDGQWSGELVFGSDLFANWCDDVIEPGEPEPVIEETWQVEGVLQVRSLPEPGQCGQARAALQQAMAVGPNGERLDLGELDLINETWGCFAG